MLNDHGPCKTILDSRKGTKFLCNLGKIDDYSQMNVYI